MSAAVYPDGLDVRPLTTWPGVLTPSEARLRSPFSTALSRTMSDLGRELSALRATRPVLEVAIEPNQFRIDGRPRATARAEHPGVVLALPRTAHGPLRYATDRFETWQDNLRAIVLGLEALRRVERYGIVRRGEQYTGFRAIESGTRPMSRVDALAFLASAAGRSTLSDVTDPDFVAAAYREAVKRLHPDAGGSAEEFQRLQEAMRVLRGDVR